MLPMVCISCSTVLPYAAVSCDLSSARRPACASICVRDFPQKSPWTWTWPSINCSSLECLADSLFLYEPNVFSLAVSTTLQEKVQKLIKRLLEFDGKRLVISFWAYGRTLYEIAYKHKVTHHTVSFQSIEDLTTFFMSTWWGDSKNMEEIEFSRWQTKAVQKCAARWAELTVLLYR